jgi:SAM-dependent methyltransferase
MYQKDFGSTVIFNKLNAGCGYELIETEGWLNVDKEMRGPSEHFRIWDMTTPPTELEYDLTERFDFILVNHVLCTMKPHLVHKVLINLHRCLKPGGKIQVIDMNLLKVFKAYEEERYDDIPIEDGNSDFKLCMAISGYGTRDSLFTPKRLVDELVMAGFREYEVKSESEYDTRPKESLIVEGTK